MSAHNNKQLARLKTLLKELFQLDKPELDFGLYKVMHAKSAQIKQFLNDDLLREIEAAFGAEGAGRVQQAEQKVTEAIDQAKLYGAPDPEATPGVAQARANYKLALDGGNTEAEIYDHLYRFFERYYDNGDFLSKRYYARENDTRAAPYSVPYDGREVYLHWANKDQYYIKSGEYLNNFSFDLTEAARLHREKQPHPTDSLDFGPQTTPEGQPLKVHMRLAQAQEGEHGNIKAGADQKREFIPLLSGPVELNAQGELVLNFEYKVLPEGYPIDAAAEAALKARYDFKNKGDLPAHWMADVFLQALQALPQDAARTLPLLAEPVPTDTQKKRPLLAKYIQQYTARNTMDYFIHKDLGGFLKRELDFYIKNEVMRLDDIENADAPRVEHYLGKIKALRRIAHQLIAFLAQLEDFQKKLWLKKKFVTETQYCITLDRVPQALYAAIAANAAQREEWVKLFAIDEIAADTAQLGYSVPLTEAFLNENPFLLIDTALYDAGFKAELLASIDGLDAQCDGVLIHSENFQALGLMQAKYQSHIQAAYIDPPYNTGSDGFQYKDSYQHSSWMELIKDRVSLAKNILKNNGYHFTHIDYIEASYLAAIHYDIFGRSKGFPPFNVKTATPAGFKVVNPGPVNVSEQIYCFAKGNKDLNSSYVEAGYQSDYGKVIVNINMPVESWIIDSINNLCYKLLLVLNKKELDKKFGSNVAAVLLNEARSKYAIENANSVFATFGPHNPSKSMQVGIKSSRENPNNVVKVEKENGGFHYLINGRLMAFYSSKLKSIDGKLMPTQHLSDFWSDLSWDSISNEGGVTLKNGKKPVKLIRRIINLAAKTRDDIFLDYFAGSGTTGHAVIDQNRIDGGGKKYILCEVSNYFDEILRVRMLHCCYSTGWNDGKPVARDGISHCFKYLRLESYEDTLNNLSLRDDPARDLAIANNPALRQDYVLNYWLDVETQGSPSLLNVAAFKDPTAYQMRIKQPGTDVLRLQTIDLLETFNWLLGLWVTHLAAPQTFEADFSREVDPLLPKDQNTRLVCVRAKPSAAGPYWFRLVEGYTLKVPGDESTRQATLVVWRKLTDDAERDNAVLQHFLMEKLAISPREATFAVIYVNGSHTLPNPVVEGEKTKVRLIEEAFHQAMWSQDGA